MTVKSPEIKAGARYLVLSALTFSVMSLCVKLAGKTLPSQMIVSFRSLFTFVVSFALLSRANVGYFGTNRRLLFLRGFFGFLGLDCFYYSLSNLPLAEATVIQYTNPIFTALLAAFFLKERIGWRLILSVGVCLFGVVLAARPGFLFGAGAAPANTFALVTAFFGAVFSACAYVLVRQVSRTEHEFIVVFYFPLVALPFSIPQVVPVFKWPSAWEWMFLFGVGVTAQAAQIFMTRGMRTMPAAKAVTIMYLQIVFAAVWGALFLRELPSIGTVLGSVCILAGIWLTTTPQTTDLSSPG